MNLRIQRFKINKEDTRVGNVRRVYVEKKPDFAVKAKELRHEIRHYLGIEVENVRVLIRYDVENVSEDTYGKALQTVFSEPPVDHIYEDKEGLGAASYHLGDAEPKGKAHTFSVEYLPGQFDQRADSAEQCVKLLNEDEEPVIRSATTYVIYGDITGEQLAAIKNHCINPVDSRETERISRIHLCRNSMSRRWLRSLTASARCRRRSLRNCMIR